MKLLSFGEVLWDVYPEEQFIGGAPLNFAAHFVKNGGQASMLSAVGNDELGKKTLATIKQWGVDVSYVSILDTKETGKCLVTLDEHHIPSYNLLDDVAYDEIHAVDMKEDVDVLYFGTLALRHSYNQNTLNQMIEKYAFKEIFVDMNIRPPYYSKESIAFALSHATMIKISDEELPVVLKELGFEECDSLEEVSVLLAKHYPNLKLLILTLGEKGAFVYNATNHEFFSCPAKKVKVASTVGAGDSFSSSFLASYLKTNDIHSSLELATKVSAFVVSKIEAIPDYTMDEL